MRKYIFVTGGVCSSLGKGVASASIGHLMENCGYSVSMVKIDPYLNVDAGNMNPYQHGEVFVTEDGAESDLDLGNYARFTSGAIKGQNSITTGQVYQEVIRRERRGDYLGHCVQVIPHVTDEIKRRIYIPGENADLTVVEVGGTVGDIESIPFLEAVRQIIHELPREDSVSIHVSLVPRLSTGEIKTKPTQHSVKLLREIGIQPDMLLCRTENEMKDEFRRKIAMFTNIGNETVFSAHDVRHNIYEVPGIYNRQGVDRLLCQHLNIDFQENRTIALDSYIKSWRKAEKKVEIAMVGKYVWHEDSYKSVDESLIHASMKNNVQLKLNKIPSESLHSFAETSKILAGAGGILIPGGFGVRGVEGMLNAICYARKMNIPFLGICLGMQLQVVEWSRNIIGIEDAHSGEFVCGEGTKVVDLLEEQKNVKGYGATMYLGNRESQVREGTLAFSAYGSRLISECHRHRYEVQERYRNQLEESGLIFSVLSSDGAIIEGVEWPGHPWALGVQFHPEFNSRPMQPNPLFRDFIAASGGNTSVRRS